ncbi:MAG: ABC transporter ATP-binding protein [Firmicutes bacterium]|uniref:ABC transporter ATP-binding protein n=1 Tax=Candidatus Scybalomonas excrementavium TaxID=2840943 RepID=A0A9D9N6V2_9FIRM|nr:ABC transporter ATP-binding protein [Candidatus Scybalomonas excrementavium]
MIRLEHISKSYTKKGGQSISVLNEITCSIEKGEMVAIIGRSGAGKTTLLNILSGLLKEDKGEYFFDNECISNLNRKKRDEFREKNIGMIVQDYALLHSLSAQENILLPIKYRKHDKEAIDEKKQILSEKLGITHCLDKKVYELSGGECQRVAIARALIKEPSVILADEPTGSLDQKSEQEVLKLLYDLKEQGKTIVVVTHSTHVANYCDRILEIVDGKMKAL